jgi:hypothetical protein
MYGAHLLGLILPARPLTVSNLSLYSPAGDYAVVSPFPHHISSWSVFPLDLIYLPLLAICLDSLLIRWSGVGLSPLVRRPLFGLLYQQATIWPTSQPQMMSVEQSVEWLARKT